MIPIRALRRLLVAYVVGAWAVVGPAPPVTAAPEAQADWTLRVDGDRYAQERVSLLEQEMRRALRVIKVGTDSIETDGLTVRAALRRPEDMDRAIAALRGRFALDEVALTGGPPAEISIGEDPGSVIAASLLDAGIQSGLAAATDRSVASLRTKLQDLGVANVTVRRDDLGRIRVSAHDQAALDRVRNTYVCGGGVELRPLWDASSTVGDQEAKPTLLYRGAADGGGSVEAEESPVIEASEMIDALQAVDPNSGRPVVQFRLDWLKAARRSEALAARVGARVAVASGGEIIAIGRIDRAQSRTVGQISGDFSVDKAAEVAALLRRGMNSAPLVSVEDVSLGVPGASQRAPN